MQPAFDEELPPFAGKYVPVRFLGRGGMGLVFEAKHIRLGSRFAVKLLSEELRGYPELIERFSREADAASMLTSPHAVRIIDYEIAEDGRPYIVMELLHGEDLDALIVREGRQPVETAVSWILQACDALGEAHDLGIVHRDIKPSNLFLADVDGMTILKVLDFGVAKRDNGRSPQITSAVVPLGTPQYMAPEQARSASTVDARCDIWSLGVTLYELVTGRTPYAEHQSAVAAIAAVAADPVVDIRTHAPELPAAFAEIVMKALEKDPAARWPSIAEFAAALTPFAGVMGLPRAQISDPPLPLCASSRTRTTGASLFAEKSGVRTLRSLQSARPRWMFAAGAAAACALIVGTSWIAGVGSAAPAHAAAVVASEVATASDKLGELSPRLRASDAPAEPELDALKVTHAAAKGLPIPASVIASAYAKTTPATSASVRVMPTDPRRLVGDPPAIDASAHRHTHRAASGHAVAAVHGGLSGPGF